MTSELKVNFFFLFRLYGVVGLYHHAPHTKFFKRKKEKKESHTTMWKVSKKPVFRIKYYPTGGDFIRNPKGLNLLF
jgi:hypothetical protein